MLLTKPDRKYKETKFWLTHMYFVHDFLKSFFAVSMLDDADFQDCQALLFTLEAQRLQLAS